MPTLDLTPVCEQRITINTDASDLPIEVVFLTPSGVCVYATEDGGRSFETDKRVSLTTEESAAVFAGILQARADIRQVQQERRRLERMTGLEWSSVTIGCARAYSGSDRIDLVGEVPA